MPVRHRVRQFHRHIQNGHVLTDFPKTSQRNNSQLRTGGLSASCAGLSGFRFLACGYNSVFYNRFFLMILMCMRFSGSSLGLSLSRLSCTTAPASCCPSGCSCSLPGCPSLSFRCLCCLCCFYCLFNRLRFFSFCRCMTGFFFNQNNLLKFRLHDKKK